MKQKVLKLMCLLCVCMMGASAWAQEEVVILSEDFSSITAGDNTSTSGSSSSWNADNENFPKASRVSAYQANGAVRVGTGSAPGHIRTKSLDLSGNGGKYIVQFDVKGWSSVEGSVKVTSSNGATETVTYTATMSGSFETKSVSFSDGTASTTITIATTAKRAFFDNVKIYYVSGGGDTPATPSISFATSSKTLEVGATYTQTATAANIGNATVEYSSDNTAVATVNSTTGEVTAVAAGTANITASVTVDETEYTDTYEVVVWAPLTFNKVTNKNQLVAGNEYIIVSIVSNEQFAMGAQSGTIRSKVEVSVSNNSVEIDPTEVAVLTLGGTTDAWTFLASDNNKYLAWTSENTLNEGDDATATSAQWIVTDNFNLKNKYDNTRILQYNSGSPRFACYTGSQKDAVLYVKEGSPVGKDVATVEISATTLYLDGAAATVKTDGPAITLSTTDASIASVSGTTVTPEGEGVVTITATWDEDATFAAGSKEFTVTVLDPEKGLTVAKALTVAEAKAVIDESYSSSASTEDYYVKGIISKIDSYNSSYKSITYWISDDGTTTNQFEVYGGLSFDGISFTGKENLQVGATVVVKGKITYYSKNSVYEFSQNSNLVSLQYTRVTSANNWGTICLPYNATVTGAKLYLLAGKELDGGEVKSLVFEEETEIEAGIPYAFKATGSALVATYKTTTEYADADDWNGMYGTYSAIAGGSYGSVTNLYLMTADKVQKANPANSTLAANRAYINMDEVDEYTGGASVKAIRMYFDGTVEDATGINGLTPALNEGNTAIYNVNGQRMETLQKGINIVGGKKVIIK